MRVETATDETGTVLVRVGTESDAMDVLALARDVLVEAHTRPKSLRDDGRADYADPEKELVIRQTQIHRADADLLLEKLRALAAPTQADVG